MDVFIGTMVLVFVGALISGLMVLGSIIENHGKLNARRAGTYLIWLASFQAVIILLMVAHPAIRNADSNIAELVQPVFWMVANLAIGLTLTYYWRPRATKR